MHRPPAPFPKHLRTLSAIAFLGIGACSQGEPEEGPYVRDILQADGVARSVGKEIEAELLHGVVAGETELALESLAEDFHGHFPRRDAGRTVANDGLDLRLYGKEDMLELGREEFAALLGEHVAGWESAGRLAFESERFYLSETGDRAHGVGEIRVAGQTTDGGRVDVHVEGDFELVLQPDLGWQLTRFEGHDGTRVEGGPPPFVEVSAALGFHFNESPTNRAMMQAAIDEHRTLALGGLTALDWNRDGFWDLIGTTTRQQSVLFLNDGVGGFVRKELPVKEPHDCSNFMLWFDLDGDGLEELVGSQPIAYEGDRARLGIYTRRDGEWVLLDRALEFPNPVGRRHVAMPTIVPCDVDGDGLVDLIAGTYGDAKSRGEDFNTVLAHDGGDNHLFMNRGGLEFSEESEARGIHGTQYTFVVQPFDFDGDGDTDLFEGNDFGPNVLWVNDGTGHFRADRESILSGESAYTMGVTLADYDNTGQWSMYIANMFSEAGNRIASLADGLSDEMRAKMFTIASGNMLYAQGKDGGWSERGHALHCNKGEWAWGTNFCDLDNDGDRDLIVTNGFTSHSQEELPDW